MIDKSRRTKSAARQRWDRSFEKRRKAAQRKQDLYITIVLIVGLIGSSIFIPIFLSHLLKDNSGAFLSAGMFSMVSLAIIFWSYVQTIKNTKIKGADELERQVEQAISTLKLDTAGTNTLQDREIRDLRETIKNVDGLTSMLDARLQELNKNYLIVIKIMQIVQYLEYIEQLCEDTIKVLEESVLNRKFPTRKKPPHITTDDLDW